MSFIGTNKQQEESFGYAHTLITFFIILLALFIAAKLLCTKDNGNSKDNSDNQNEDEVNDNIKTNKEKLIS